MDCSTCFTELDNPEIFPKDFPKEWKLCCLCRAYANKIVRIGIDKVIREYGKYITVPCHKEAFLERIKSVDNLIRVN